MCYSAQIRVDYHRYVRVWGADIDIKEFVRLYWERQQGAKLRIPKAMDAAFSEPKSVDERKIKALIEQYDAEQISKTQTEIFAQRKRLADAERTLQTKVTKAATESRRIASIRKLVFLLSRSGLGYRNGCQSLRHSGHLFPHAFLLVPPIVPPKSTGCKWTPSDRYGHESIKKPAVMRVSRTSADFLGYSDGGQGRNRTGVRGFAGRCMTILPPGHP
jgi:hypothetical protein